ncbi:MAG: DUF2240 family protein [Halobacteriaceae archaeon]
MSLEQVIAVPFRQKGATKINNHEFVVILSLDREWFSPDQSKQIIKRGLSEGILQQNDDTLIYTENLNDIQVPDDFEPDPAIIQEKPLFEKILTEFDDAGYERQNVVANINKLQQAAGITANTAAIMYAYQEGMTLEHHVEEVKQELTQT